MSVKGMNVVMKMDVMLLQLLLLMLTSDENASLHLSVLLTEVMSVYSVLFVVREYLMLLYVMLL